MSVNNVSALTDAIKYLNDVDVNEKKTNIVGDLKDSIFSPVNLIFGTLEVGSGLKEATKTEKLKDAAKALNSTSLAGINASKSPIKQAGEAVKYFASKADAKALEKAAKAAKASTKTGFFASIGKAFNGVKKGVSGLISKIPGVSALGKSTFGKVLKGTGALGMMAIEGVLGIVTEVIPAFAQGGVKSGVKQLGKTSISVTGSGLGWAGGSVAGKAIGGAIGSIFGPVGTVVGGAVGTFFGSIAGSIIGGGVARKIAGKSESEKAQEKQFEDAAVEISQDKEAVNQINALVAQKVQEEIANGTVDDDTEKMAAYINSGALNSSISSSQLEEPAQDTTSAYNPTFTSNNAIEAVNTQAQATNTVNPNYWNDLAQKIQQGDSSIYDISDDELQAVFKTPAKTSTISTETDLLADTKDKQVNYFG